MTKYHLEIPLIVSKGEKYRRYRLLKDPSSSQWQIQSVDDINDDMPSDGRGCCSISHISTGTVTTSYKTDDSQIMILSFLSSQGISSTLEMDLKELSNIVSCRAFDHKKGFMLQIVDSYGCIVILKFTLSSLGSNESYHLEPQAHAEAIFVPQLLLDEDLSVQLYPSMVCHFNSDTILLGWNPHLISVSLSSHRVEYWSNNAGAVGLLTRLGLSSKKRREEEPMAPVSAITSIDPLVFSLHNDGTLRRWHSKTSSSFIIGPIEAADEQMALPGSWNTGSNEGECLPLLKAALYQEGGLYALAASVPIFDKGGRTSRLKVWSGDLTTETDPVLQIQEVPEQETQATIIAMSWQTHPEAALECWWSDGQLMRYPNSLMQIVSTEAELVLSTNETMETNQIELLIAHGDIAETAMAAATTDGVMQTVDTYWLPILKQMDPSLALLRSVIRSRLDTSLPPHDDILQLALLGIHEWRRQERPVPRRYRSPNPKAATPQSHELVTTTPGGSLYESLVCQAPTTDIVLPEASSIGGEEQDLKRVAYEHQERWKVLLKGIFKGIPACPGTLCHHEVQGLVLVRSGGDVSACRNALSDSAPTNSIAARLDQAALDMIETVLDDPGSMGEFVRLQDMLYRSLAMAQLAWDPDGVKSILSAMITVASSHSWNDRQEALHGLQINDEGNIREFLLKPPKSSCLPGLGCLGDYQTPASPVRPSSSIIKPAAALATMCLQSANRLCLGRLLVLGILDVPEPVLNLAAHACIYTNMLLWASRQAIPASDLQWGLDESSGSPIAKRLFNGVEPKMNLLEASLGSVVAAPHVVAGGYGIDKPAALVTALMQKMYCWNSGEPVSGNMNLPDLGIMPPSNVVKHPRIVLRLLVPAVEYLVNGINESTRTQLLADVLLIESRFSSTAKHCPKLSEKAFALLQFNAHDWTRGMENLHILKKHALSNPHLVAPTIKTIRQALTAVEKMVGMEALRQPDQEDYPTMWNMMFDVAVQAQQWTTAYVACLDNPRADRRLGCAQRLVRAMVDAGDLRALLQLVSSTDSESHETTVGTFRVGGDLYSIAAETLEKASYRDIYYLRLVSDEPFVDYPGALFALHANRGEWRRAAQAMDLRLVIARKALADGPTVDLDEKLHFAREVLIAEDMATAATACADAILRVQDKDLHFIVTGEYGAFPTLPISLLSKQGHEEQSSVATIGGAQQLVKSERGQRYMSSAALRLRSIRCGVLARMLKDKHSGSYELARLALVEEFPTEELDQKVVHFLLKLGYYPEGLALATAMDAARGQTNQSVFYDTLVHLLCEFLLPIATKKPQSTSRPTFSQLQDAFDSLSSDPSLLIPTTYTKHKLLELASISDAAMSLLRRYVGKYTSSLRPVALDVATNMIRETQGSSALPPWLEDLLIYGEQRTVMPGLFHKRPRPGSTAFLGNPSALLSLYTERGLLLDATRIVTTVLTAEDRKEKASKRLPEKGDMDCVPYSKIDFLYNLMGVIMKRDLPQATKHELQGARETITFCLEEHFDLMRISEEGLQSARLLS